MCGIAGIVQWDGQRPDAAVLEQMAQQLRHRGPDGGGLRIQDCAGLAHRRLRVIDPLGGVQPMVHLATGVTVVFNGEIFNYAELNQQLQQAGHRLRTRADVELLLHAYLEWGERCVERLNGQWGFAIWDPRQQSLFASRDHFGIVPLYYAQVGGALLLASEIKALLAHPALDARLDLLALDQLFSFWTTVPPRTCFAGIRELPPAHCLRAREGQLETWRYWNLDFSPVSPPPSVEEAGERVLELLVDAVQLRLRADVAVGSYLSGGLDSSLTSALVAEHARNLPETFSVTFDDERYDESRHQQLMAQHLHTRHHALICSTASIAKALPEVVWHAEKPLLRTAPVPMFLLSAMTHAHGLKVVVTGEGADEVFAGSPLFREAKVRRYCGCRPGSAWRAKLLWRLVPPVSPPYAAPRSALQRWLGSDPDELDNPFFSHLPRWRQTSRIKALFSDEVRALLAGRDALAELQATLPADFASWPPLGQAQYLESSLLLPGVVLSSQGDRMAMGHSVELRLPFLDHRLVSYVARLPPRFKLHVLDEKYLLRRIAAGRVPEPICQRPKQPYRAPDLGALLVGRTAPSRQLREVLQPEALAQHQVFAPQRVQKLLRRCHRNRPLSSGEGMALAGVLSTELLMQQFGVGTAELQA